MLPISGTLKPIPRQGGADRDGPVLSAAFVPSGCRPGYKDFEQPASAPDFLDFNRTSVILKDLPEKEFRQAIVDTLLLTEDLGLNRNKGASRAEAYLDMVTWDDKIRTGWKNDNSGGTSSCGMYIRNVLWLCGARNTPLLEKPYVSGILTDLLKFATTAGKSWGSEVTAKTFYPKIGDILYLYKISNNDQHIFTLIDIDKEIVNVDGQATVLNKDGSPAKEITFTSIDGGQFDGSGKDGNGVVKPWGSQAIRRVHRTVKLKDGHFPNLGVSWPLGTKDRPLNTWISIWEEKDKFTAPRIIPVRLGPIGISDTGKGPLEKAVPIDDSAAPVDFYTWPQYTSPVPKSILDEVEKNRTALGVVPAALFGPYPSRENHQGYSYGGHDYAAKSRPAVVTTGNEAESPELNGKLDAIYERLVTEMGGEGSITAVMTGDRAGFTWGRGLAHKGALETIFAEFIGKHAAVKDAFMRHGIILDSGKIWKIVDLVSNTVQTGEDAIALLNGVEPAAEKQKLLSVFIRLTEKFHVEAAQTPWDTFKRLYFPGKPLKDGTRSVVTDWDPVAVCYVIHCNAWGNFAGWPAFARTGGDLRKILRLEVDFTGYYEDKGSYILVPPFIREVHASITMINNMGEKCMVDRKIVEPCSSASDMAAKRKPGDVVFDMGGKSPPFYILHGTEKMYDRKNKYDTWLEENHALPMAALIKKLEALPKGETKATLDRYVAQNNPNRMKHGLRPQVAMKAVLHKNEGLAAAYVIELAESAEITLTDTPDQYNVICDEIGLGKYDTWVEKNHPLPMDRLIAAIDKLGYKEAKATRDWYAATANRKKEKWGPRPRIALDAVLHKNEGQSAAWILNDCAQAQISPTSNPDQYEIIRKTIGVA